MTQRANGSKRTTYRVGSVEGRWSTRGRTLSESSRSELRDAARAHVKKRVAK
jgi:hypothetical protein